LSSRCFRTSSMSCSVSSKRKRMVNPSAASLPRPMSLADAARQLGLKKKTLYNAFCRGDLRGGFIGGAIYTDADALREWWNRICQESNSRRAYTCENAKAARPSSSSKTQARNIAPAAALKIAQGLRRG